ncbi:hypothetical protein Fmac_031196 [Flemingia macrophylla]|uniref:Oxidative stress 3 n=1 Tax=Flemingia macrophylla TaxID=520843 RepID=A0ABD1L1C9_9FABA
MEQLKYKVVEADNNKGQVDECGLVRSFSSDDDSESGFSNDSSLDSDSFEEVTAPASSFSSLAYQFAAEPLNDMSSLFQQLPIKRGLSKYYEGKSRSFTSLAKVRSLEDLAKPENPYNKKLKCCRSYGWGMDETQGGGLGDISMHGFQSGSCSSLSANKSSDSNIIGRRPPISPHRSTTTSSIANQTALFV